MLGHVVEVNMEELDRTGKVLMKIGVVDLLKVPNYTRVSDPKLSIYLIPVKVIEVVELGWMRPESELQLDFDSIEEIEESMCEERHPKKLKLTDGGPSTPSVQILGGTGVQASARTICALEQREKDLQMQDAPDAV